MKPIKKAIKMEETARKKMLNKASFLLKRGLQIQYLML